MNRAIEIDLGRTIGEIKPLHGVNNGPVGYGSLVDVTHHYRAAEFPLVRLHDPNFPHPREIDIHTIFPDFGRDPDDASAYDFSKSDYYVRKIVDTGARILWRLGESIEHTPTKYYVHPPADSAKWARVCIGIVRHYNEGWANGFHYGIRYWEIWNEPEGGGGLMWNGTPEQFFDLYRTAAPMIKAHDPSLLVGGYAAALPREEKKFFEGFLEMCRKEKLPLDFFSWHSYNDDPELVREISAYVREVLDRHGFAKTESHFNEWNFFDADWTTLFLPGNEIYRRDMFERAKGAQGASYAASVLLTLQDCAVDQANYYDGQPFSLWCGLFDYYGVPTKTFEAFRLFNDFRRYGGRLAVSNDNAGVYACAGAKEDGYSAVLVANYRGASGFYEIGLGSVSAEGYTAEEYRIDGERSGQLVARHSVEAGKPLKLFISKQSVVYLKIAVR